MDDVCILKDFIVLMIKDIILYTQAMIETNMSHKVFL
jgi:hypothetical protein